MRIALTALPRHASGLFLCRALVSVLHGVECVALWASVRRRRGVPVVTMGRHAPEPVRPSCAILGDVSACSVRLYVRTVFWDMPLDGLLWPRRRVLCVRACNHPSVPCASLRGVYGDSSGHGTAVRLLYLAAVSIYFNFYAQYQHTFSTSWRPPDGAIFEGILSGLLDRSKVRNLFDFTSFLDRRKVGNLFDFPRFPARFFAAARPAVRRIGLRRWAARRVVRLIRVVQLSYFPSHAPCR